MRYYVNGVQVATRTFTGNVGDFNTWRIGAYGGSPFGFFDGSIDDVRIYDRALTPAEVQGDMVTRVGGSDTTAPTAPTAFAKTGATATTIATSWTPSTDNVGVTGYRLYRGGNQVDTTTDPAYTFTGLTCNTSYSLGVEAVDAAGNVSPRTPLTASSGACDTTAPSVSITAPAGGSTVSGIVSITAAASDNSSVAGVQFKVDGANLGSEDTNSPYSIGWDTAAVTPGNHTLTAVARDPSGNTATSAPVTVTVAAPPAGQRPAGRVLVRRGRRHGRGRRERQRRAGDDRQRDVGDRQVRLRPELQRHQRARRPARLGVFYKAGFTLEAWVNKSGAKKDVAVLGTWNYPQGGPMLWIDDIAGRYHARLGAAESDFLDSGQAPATGQWQHIAAHLRRRHARDSSSTARRWPARRSPATPGTTPRGASAPMATRRSASSTASSTRCGSTTAP